MNGSQCVDSKFVVKIPDCLAPEKAAIFLNTGLTAYDALKYLKAANGGKIVAVIGGNPCVGSNSHIAAKIALAMGNKAVVFGANSDNGVESYTRSYGADFIVLGDA